VPQLTPSRGRLCIGFDEGNECLENNGDHNDSAEEKIEYILNYNDETQAETFENVPDAPSECRDLSFLDAIPMTTSETNVTDNAIDLNQVPIPHNIDDLFLSMLVSSNTLENTNITPDENNIGNCLLRQTKKTATSITKTKTTIKVNKNSARNITANDNIDEETRKKAMAKARVDRCRAKTKERNKKTLERKALLEKENQKLEHKVDKLRKEYEFVWKIMEAHGQAQPDALMTIMSMELGLI